MGLAASQSRYLALAARKSDLELTGQQINQGRMQLANLTNDLFNRWFTFHKFRRILG